MIIMTKHSIPHIFAKKRFRRSICVLLLCVFVPIFAVKSCTANRNDQRQYALESVSTDFEPLVTPVILRARQGEPLNTRLLYSVYITLFDNRGYPDKSDVRKRLVSCFYFETEDRMTVPVQDMDAVFDRVQEEFGITVGAVQRRKMGSLAENLAPGYIDSVSILKKNLKSGDGRKNNIGLANFAWNALRCGSGYVYGAVGQTIAMPFLDRQQDRFKGFERANLTDAQTDSIFLRFGGRPGFDCCGLIKAYSWFDESTGKISSDNPFAMPDCTANGLYGLAAVKGNIGDMPDTPGLVVHRDGHVGVYVGGGEVIEARGNRYGVVKTELKGRGWEHYFQVPALIYVQSGTYRIQDEQVVISEGTIVDEKIRKKA